MPQNQDFYRQIHHALGGEDLAPELDMHAILAAAADWLSSAHAWYFLVRPMRLSIRGAIQIAAGTYVHATRTLTELGTFASYEPVAGDRLQALSGTGVVAKAYAVEARLDDDSITLAGEGLGADADGSIDIVARLPNDSIQLPSDFLAMWGERPLWARDNAASRFEFTTLQELSARRTSSIASESSFPYIGCVREALDEATGGLRSILDFYPSAESDNPDALIGFYRARILIDTSDELAVVPLPEQKPLIAFVLAKACRAFALGLEEGDEEGSALSLEDRLERLTGSSLWRAAKKEDGLSQGTFGRLRGGVGRFGPRLTGNTLLRQQVDAPSST